MTKFVKNIDFKKLKKLIFKKDYTEEILTKNNQFCNYSSIPEAAMSKTKLIKVIKL